MAPKKTFELGAYSFGNTPRTADGSYGAQKWTVASPPVPVAGPCLIKRLKAGLRRVRNGSEAALS
jgi:hypothetical protein